MARTLVQEFTKGLWKEVPPFRLVLGLCPTLGVSNSVENGVGMGIAVTFVLVCGNILVSLLRKVIPSKVRIACFIVVIATFVVVVELVMKAYAYPLFITLGVFIPLIVVNCILLGRAEAFAYKNNVVRSTLDGLGIGIGYTFALAAVATVREVLGAGTFSVPFWHKLVVFDPSWFEPFEFMLKAPGAFVCLGLMLGIMNLFPSK
ncbi:MAG: electron transport complex subunit E [Thermodesulfobacteriota bacterium]